MTKEFIFDVWAPGNARWSPWAKPVLFGCLSAPNAPWMHEPEGWDASWAPAADTETALVVDLPGRESVVAGMALAQRGYRPVPLYNALPAPTLPLDPVSPLPPQTLVEVRGIVEEILRSTEWLQRLALPAEAPPAFLLDGARRGEGRRPNLGVFDNRSVSFTTDFPSGNFLLAHGVRSVVLVQPTGDAPQADLAHTLRRWQETGVTVSLKRLDTAGAPTPCDVPKPSWFGWIWQRALVAFGLRRNAAGGFGGWVPEPSSG